MAWTGLGCFIQCINSIIWNHNMIDRAPIYSDIGKLDNIAHRHSLNYITVVHIQAGLNAAIPACSLCINRRLYKIATAKVVMATPSENRRAVIIDLFIGIGIPILQMAMREYHQPLLSTYTHAIQSTLFRDIVTTYSRILAPVLTLCSRHRPSSSTTHGPWRLVVYLSFIVVSILVWSLPFGPSLGSLSTV